jgi:hypothetical protein
MTGRPAARPGHLTEPQLAPHLQDETWRHTRKALLTHSNRQQVQRGGLAIPRTTPACARCGPCTLHTSQHHNSLRTTATCLRATVFQSTRATGSASQFAFYACVPTSAHCYLLFCAALPPRPLLLAYMPHRCVRGLARTVLKKTEVCGKRPRPQTGRPAPYRVHLERRGRVVHQAQQIRTGAERGQPQERVGSPEQGVADAHSGCRKHSTRLVHATLPTRSSGAVVRCHLLRLEVYSNRAEIPLNSTELGHAEVLVGWSHPAQRHSSPQAGCAAAAPECAKVRTDRQDCMLRLPCSARL